MAPLWTAPIWLAKRLSSLTVLRYIALTEHPQLLDLFARQLFVYQNTVFRIEHYRKLSEMYKLFCTCEKFGSSGRAYAGLRRTSAGDLILQIGETKCMTLPSLR